MKAILPPRPAARLRLDEVDGGVVVARYRDLRRLVRQPVRHGPSRAGLSRPRESASSAAPAERKADPSGWDCGQRAPCRILPAGGGAQDMDRPTKKPRVGGRSHDGTDQLFRVLVEGVVDYAIYMLDPNGIVTTWNAGAERSRATAPRRSSAGRSRPSTRPRIATGTFPIMPWPRRDAPAATRPRAGASARMARASGPAW